MRQLTKQQKKLIDFVVSERKRIYGLETSDFEDLDNEYQDKLEQLNDTEILVQEVNRYLWDKNSINHQFKI